MVVLSVAWCCAGHTYTTCGTPEYFAPEMARHSADECRSRRMKAHQGLISKWAEWLWWRFVYGLYIYVYVYINISCIHGNTKWSY